MGKIDWDVVTNYTDVVTTTLKTVTFPKVQEQVYLRNQGNANITYTIGSQSGTLTPGQSVTVNQDVSSYTVQAVSGTHTFELRAKEKGTEIEEAPSDVPSQIASLTTSLADRATKAELNALGQLKFIGVYATLSALQTAYPSGTNGIALVSADGYGYYWNNSAWTKGAQFQSTGIALKSITSEMLKDAVLGKNLFNKDSVTQDMYVRYTDGLLISNTTYVASDYIEVEANTSYTRSYSNQMAFYDANKVYISGVNTTATPTVASSFTTPANAKYIRVTALKTILSSMQVEKGSTATSYESYGKYKLPNLVIDFPPVTLNDSDVKPNNLSDYAPGKNLFNKDAVTNDYYVSQTTGLLASNTAYAASDWITVDANTQYSRTYSHQMAFYDSSKNYISGVSPLFPSEQPSTFTTPANCKYIRLTVNKNALSTMQIEKGASSTSYESYGKYTLKNLSIGTVGTSDTVLLFLPSEICIAVGRTIELYNSQVAWAGNLNNYHFKWVCSVGKAMKRKWSCLGDAAKIGSYSLTCTIYDNNMNQVATATTTVKIVVNTITTAKKVLPIGDSLTNGKAWLGELRTLSSNQLSFVGTRWNGDIQGGTKNHEGRSGWTASNYLTNSTYTFEANGVGSNNPFWNPNTSAFDFAYYKSTYSIIPDIVQLYLGTNGIALDPTSNVNSIKGIVDGIRVTDPNIPIYIVFTLYRGDQNGIGNQLSSDGYSAGSGVWKLEEDRKVYNLMVALNEALNNYTNLYFIPVALTHDSENNFKSNTATPVNPRSSITEVIDAEATHPSPRNDGYFQMADIMFSTYAAHIN
jgi:hypothetical protein